MKRPAVIFPVVGFALTVPALVIWAAVGLSRAGNPLGDALGAWLRGSFSEMAVLVMWVGFPAAALVFGVTGFALGKHNKLNAALVGLSIVLLIGLTFAAMSEVGG
ncbi:MAG: hypothetical protein OEZ02_09045 [Anaerolineae bacterium]|nr:hypothetical protein [Anaerolineae bacterium]